MTIKAHCLRSKLFPAILLSFLAAPSANATLLITNGGFESGLTGWSIADGLGGDGTFFSQTGTSSPSNGITVPAPPEGASAAMSDGQGPGSHVLYQDFVVPVAVSSAVIQFDLFIGNRFTQFNNPASLDFGIAAFNQQARVDILVGGADPFSVAGADVLLNLFQTNPGDALVSGYTTITADISSLLSAHAGETLRLRFAETDNAGEFQLGVDKVAISTVPEPPTWLLLGLGIFGFYATRKAKTVASATLSTNA